MASDTKTTQAVDKKLFADLQLTDEVLGNDYQADGVTVIGTCRVPLGDLLRKGIVILDAPLATVNAANTVSATGPILGQTTDDKLVVKWAQTAGTDGWSTPFATTAQGALADTALQPGDVVDDLTTGGAAVPGSAEQLKVLKGQVDGKAAATDQAALLPIIPGDRRRIYDKIDDLLLGNTVNLRWLSMGDSIARILQLPPSGSHDHRSYFKDRITSFAKGRVGELDSDAFTAPTAGVVLHSVGNANADYAITPWAIHWEVPSGESVKWPQDGSTKEHDTFKLYYYKGPSEGTFTLQEATAFNGTYSDTAHVDVDAYSATPALGIITLSRGSIESRSYKVVGTAGTVNLVGAGCLFETVPSATWIDTVTGGWYSPSAVNTTPAAIREAWLADFAPDGYSIIVDDQPSAGLDTFLAAIDTYLDTLSPSLCTRLYLAASPRADGGGAELWPAAQVDYMRPRAIAQNYNFIDLPRLLGPYADLSEISWHGDGVHLAYEAYAYAASYGLKLLDLPPENLAWNDRPVRVFNDAVRNCLANFYLTKETEASSNPPTLALTMSGDLYDATLIARRTLTFKHANGDLTAVFGTAGTFCPGVKVGTPNVSASTDYSLLQSKASGTPEGVTTADPGDLVLLRTGALYVKESGSGNTGWSQVATLSQLATDSVAGLIELATKAEALTVEDSDQVVTASNLFHALSRMFNHQFAEWSTSVNGSGAISANDYHLLRLTSGATASSDATAGVGGGDMQSASSTLATNFSLAMLSFRVSLGGNTTNGIARIHWGKSSTLGSAAMAQKGVGFEIRNNALWGVAHDGTTLYETNLSSTISTTNPVTLSLEARAGTVTFYIDGVSVGSSTAPTGNSGNLQNYIQVSVENGADAAAQDVRISNMKTYN